MVDEAGAADAGGLPLELVHGLLSYDNDCTRCGRALSAGLCRLIDAQCTRLVFRVPLEPMSKDVAASYLARVRAARDGGGTGSALPLEVALRGNVDDALVARLLDDDDDASRPCIRHLVVAHCSQLTGASYDRLRAAGCSWNAKGCWRLWRPPCIELDADAVVRLQILALREGEGDEGILKCFEHASPENRAQTGPAARFATMIRLGYSCMLTSDHSVVMEPRRGMLRNPESERIFIVSFRQSSRDPDQSAPGSDPKWFVWQLSRRRRETVEGEEVPAWMTESVSPISRQMAGLQERGFVSWEI